MVVERRPVPGGPQHHRTRARPAKVLQNGGGLKCTFFRRNMDGTVNVYVDPPSSRNYPVISLNTLGRIE